MKHVLEVCLVAATMATGVMPAAAQQFPTAEASKIFAAQTLQRGVSVNMAATNSAVAMPDADESDAWIVTVTRDGGLYFGVDAVTPDQLTEAMRSRPRNREQKLYIKADARATYADVERVLPIAHASEFETVVFLTSQPGSRQPGTMVAPRGLEVGIDPAAAAQLAVSVQLADSGQQLSGLKINNRQIPWANLQNTLAQLLQNRSEKAVQVTADGGLNFADVVRVVDACQAVGARVVLLTSGR
jgi:biopolymer transport protein ExbD